MKGSQIAVRCHRLGMAFIMLLSLQANPVWAGNAPTRADDAGILPIETSNVNKSLIDELFGPDANNGNNGNNNNGNGNRNGNRNNRNNRHNNNNDNFNDDGFNDDGFGDNGDGNNQNNNNNNNNITKSNVDDDFKCNLFESVPFNDILSAVNALNSAVTSTACNGNSRVNVQSIVDNNKTVKDAVTHLRGYVEHPETIQADNAAEISNQVDLAIRAATTVANSFAQTDLLRKDCRQSMSAGQVASSINDLVNGLTPYALMAASLATGGAAAVPFIVGGSVITGAISSMTQIIAENGINIEDRDVRTAIVENTCQFIRLDQKYKFLIKSRQEQIAKITADLKSSQRLYSAKITGLQDKNANGLVNRRNALDKAAADISSTVSSARGQMELDKQFLKGTTDNIKICQLGIQLAAQTKDRNSYVSKLLGTLDQAMIAYGTTNIPQAQALKSSANLAINNLNSVAAKQKSNKTNFQACGDSTKSFVETIDQSVSLSQQLLKLAQDSIDKNLQNNTDYNRYKARLSSLSQKQYQAERVTKSLDKLHAYANTITQSQIDTEMETLRRGLFGNTNYGMKASPVMQWFNFVNGKHKAEVAKFNEGLESLRVRARKMTASGGKNLIYAPSYSAYTVTSRAASGDENIARNLQNFTLKQLPLGTKDHDDVCRELQGVWNHWTKAIDHLAASDAFCNMIERNIYDSNSEDKPLIQMCRGYSKTAAQSKMAAKDTPSTVGAMKDGLVKNYSNAWALVIQKRINELACVDMNQDPDATNAN